MPVAISSFVAPAVSSAHVSSTMLHAAGSRGSASSCSSKRMRPALPGGFSGAYGKRCFWPESATTQNHQPNFGPRSHDSTLGFSPFEAFSMRCSSRKWEKLP